MRNTVITPLSLLIPAAANANNVLDANYAPSTAGGLVVRSTLSDAQTFTVLNTGIVTSADVGLFYQNFLPNSPISFEIVTTSGAFLRKRRPVQLY